MKKTILTRTVTHRQFVRMVLSITILLVAVIILTCALYGKVIIARNQTYVEGMLTRYRDSLTAQIEEYVQLVQTAAYDASVRDYLQAEDAYARHQAAQQVSTLFSNLQMVQTGIDQFFLFRPDDPETSYASLGAQQVALLEGLWQRARPGVVGVYSYAYGYDGAPGSVAVIGSPVFSLNLDGRQAGVLGAVAVAIDSRVIERNLQEFYLQEGLRYSLVAADRTAFLGQSLEISEADLSAAFEAGHLERDSSGSSLLMTAIPAMDMVLVVQTDKLVLLKDLLTITLLVLGFVLCLLAGLLSMAGRISREITQPLALLTDAIKQMDADPTHMRHVPEAGNADFQMLSASLNRMLRRETRLTHELLEANRNLYESELTQKHLELQFLRSQINPHFLYNTLETIHSIAVVRRVPEAALAAKNLAKLLRYSIKGGEIMPLASELEIIQCYLSIQRLCFGDRIRAEFDVEESVKDLCIPRMCLQPLVENAVVHGLESSIEPGMLSVVCRRDERSLWITVRDTGVGIDPEELARINRLLSNPFEKTPQQGSIGMLNVARRLQLSMGDDFSMQVASERNRGTTVSLRIPLAKLEQKGAGADVSSSAG